MRRQRFPFPLAAAVDCIHFVIRVLPGVSVVLIMVAAAVHADDPPVTALAFAPDGDSIVAGSQSGLAVLTWPELHSDGNIATELQHVNDLKFSPDGTRLAVSGGAPGQVGTVEVYTWPGTELSWRSRAHDDVIYGLGWSGDGALLAAASLDRLCSVCDAASGEVVSTIEGHSRGVTAVVLLDELIVTAGLDQSLRMWDRQTGETLMTRNNHTQPVLDLALRPSSGGTALPMVASTGNDRTVRFWQPTIGRMVRFARPSSPALCLDWNSDGSTLYAGCRDGVVRRIDPERVEITGEWPVFDGWVYSLAVHPEGRQLAVGGGQGIVRCVSVRE